MAEPLLVLYFSMHEKRYEHFSIHLSFSYLFTESLNIVSKLTKIRMNALQTGILICFT
jgi:hypothetical protein